MSPLNSLPVRRSGPAPGKVPAKGAGDHRHGCGRSCQIGALVGGFPAPWRRNRAHREWSRCGPARRRLPISARKCCRSETEDSTKTAPMSRATKLDQFRRCAQARPSLSVNRAAGMPTTSSHSPPPVVESGHGRDQHLPFWAGRQVRTVPGVGLSGPTAPSRCASGVGGEDTPPPRVCTSIMRIPRGQHDAANTARGSSTHGASNCVVLISDRPAARAGSPRTTQARRRSSEVEQKAFDGASR